VGTRTNSPRPTTHDRARRTRHLVDLGRSCHHVAVGWRGRHKGGLNTSYRCSRHGDNLEGESFSTVTCVIVLTDDSPMPVSPTSMSYHSTGLTTLEHSPDSSIFLRYHRSNLDFSGHAPIFTALRAEIYTVSASSTGTVRLYGPSSDNFFFALVFTRVNVLVDAGGHDRIVGLRAISVRSTVPGVDVDRVFNGAAQELVDPQLSRLSATSASNVSAFWGHRLGGESRAYKPFWVYSQTKRVRLLLGTSHPQMWARRRVYSMLKGPTPDGSDHFFFFCLNDTHHSL